MSRDDRQDHPPDWYAAAFSRMFWAFPFLALAVGPVIHVGKEQLLIDLLPDFVGFALIAAGAGRLMRIHRGAKRVRLLALVLLCLSIPLCVQYRRQVGQAGNFGLFVIPLWPLVSLVSVVGGAMSWRLCGIIADLARLAGVPATERSALRRRGYGLIMAILTLGLIYILNAMPQWLVPALIGYLVAGLIVTCLMMGLMNQAYHICLDYSFDVAADGEDGEPHGVGEEPSLASRAALVAGVVLPILLIPVAVWNYNDWLDAWQTARSPQVKGPENDKVAHSFLDHVKKNRLDAAYELTTPNFQERMSLDDFKALIKRFDGLIEGPRRCYSASGRSGDWEPGYEAYEDADGRHIKYTVFVRRPEQSILVRRPPSAGVDEFTVVEMDTPESRRSKIQVQRGRQWNRGVELWNANKPDEAETASLKSLELTSQLADLTPKDNHYERGFHARCHQYLGRWLASAGRLQQAGEQFQQAASGFENLAREFPDQGKFYQQEAMSCYAEWGAVLAQAGRKPEADEQFRLAAGALEKWIRDFPRQSPHQLLWTCTEDAIYHAEQGRLERADELMKRLAIALERMAYDCPSLQSWFRLQLGTLPFDRCYALALAGRVRQAEVELNTARAFWKQHPQSFQLEQKRCRKAVKDKPDDTQAISGLAWFLATCVDPQFQNTAEAVTLAKRAVLLDPKAGYIWSTLGVAHYRAGEFQTATEDLQKSLELQPDNGEALFFLAITHWQLGHKPEARQAYDKAVAWMERHARRLEVLRRLRAEATLQLGVNATPQKAPTER